MTAAAERQPHDLHLRNGVRVSLRPVGVDDESEILEFLTNLSAESRRRRFFTAAIDLRAETHRELAVPSADQHGLLARVAGRGVVGHAIYVRLPLAARAEVAVEVADDFHHLGLATQLVIRLAQDAEERHITQFFADVLPENNDMLAVFRDAFATASVHGLDAIEIEFPTSGWRAAHARFQ
jgi:GNAT superfamily N-acetyltransferase